MAIPAKPRSLPVPSIDERLGRPHPTDPMGEAVAVDYTFGFVDITGFTSYCEREGEHAAIELLTRFRFITRSIAVRRGVRVAKWLGDGVMLVAVNQGPMLAAAGELLVRCRAVGLDIHVGIARGPVMLFEGDDYVGRPVNLAARLCDAAGKSEILASGLAAPLPEWMSADSTAPIALAGLGMIDGVVRLDVHADVSERFSSSVPAA